MHDTRAGRMIMECLKSQILRIFSDREYNSKAIFNESGSKTVIPAGKNASSKSRDHLQGSVSSECWKRIENECKKSVQYGKRWDAEIYFSGLKRTMGEVIKAVRPYYIAQEIALKVQVLQ